MKLILNNNMVFNCDNVGYKKNVSGELVFTTAMTGYTETLTDPSYYGQIIVFTYPMIGNYGVSKSRQLFPAENYESHKIHASGVVLLDASNVYSHHNAVGKFTDWLIDQQVPCLTGIDTRLLTKLLRDNGTMLCKIVDNYDDSIDFYNPSVHNLQNKVKCDSVTKHGNGRHKIVVIDCGVKANIIRTLLKYDTTVIQVPYSHNIDNIDYDGLVISNGPGDPNMCIHTIDILRYDCFFRKKPILGICLGAQIIAIAYGLKVKKMRYGHRGHNQPVVDLTTGRGYITSQNHGYEIDLGSSDANIIPYFKNINDGTCEGIAIDNIIAVQFHPEASGGPNDTMFVFDKFIGSI